MTPDFAKLYLLARQVQSENPDDCLVGTLVNLLRMWDDTRSRLIHSPESAPENLARMQADSVLCLLRVLGPKYPMLKVN